MRDFVFEVFRRAVSGVFGWYPKAGLGPSVLVGVPVALVFGSTFTVLTHFFSGLLL